MSPTLFGHAEHADTARLELGDQVRQRGLVPGAEGVRDPIGVEPADDGAVEREPEARLELARSCDEGVEGSDGSRSGVRDVGEVFHDALLYTPPMSESKMKGATAIVTGGGSGIGRALSLELAKRGAIVHVTDVNGASAEETAKQIGGSAKHAALDVRDGAAVQRFCDAVGRVDYMFNNAGIAVGGEVQDLSLAHWDRIIDINIRGVVHGIHAVYPGMIARGSGHIINTASLAGLLPTPLGTPYGMTKHAVVGLSVSLRAEAAAYGVRVSALCPGVIETPILDSKGPEDLPRPKWMPDSRELLTKAAAGAAVSRGEAERARRSTPSADDVALIVIPPWRADHVARLPVRAVARGLDEPEDARGRT